MTTIVISNDFQIHRRTTTTLEQSDYEMVASVWEKSDALLAGLQEAPFFKGRLRWCDLDPGHYRFLIMRNLALITKMPDEECVDQMHPIVRSLTFLISALIYCMESRADCIIDMLRINRISDNDASFDFTCSLNLTFEPPTSKEPPEEKEDMFKIIVDNET